MKQIRDPLVILGSLEGGDAIAAFGAALIDTLKKLNEHAGNRPKSKAKGKVVFTVEMEVEQGGANITGNIEAKLPKMPRGATYFWVLPDGALSLEHPQQIDMFSGPRVARPPAEAETA